MSNARVTKTKGQLVVALLAGDSMLQLQRIPQHDEQCIHQEPACCKAVQIAVSLMASCLHELASWSAEFWLQKHYLKHAAG